MTEPRILVQTEKFRIVELPNGNKVMERYDGEDAMGGQRWGLIKIGDGDSIGRWLRDYVFAHLAVCPTRKEQSE